MRSQKTTPFGCSRAQILRSRTAAAVLATMISVPGLMLSRANAASLTWGTGGAGGTGTWDTNTTADWWNGIGNVDWTDTTGTDTAVFDTTAGTVNLSGIVFANALNFNIGGYTLSGGTLALEGSTPTISTSAGTTTIGSVIAGSAGLTKAGAGTLVLTGANGYSGGTIINGGMLQIGNGVSTTNALSSGSAVTINSSGSLWLDVAGSPTFANAISGAGTLQVTAGGTGNTTTQLTGDLTNFTGVLDVFAYSGGGGKVSLNGASLISPSALIKVENGATAYLAKAGTYANNFQLYGGATTTGEAIGNLRIENNTVSGNITLLGNSSIGASGSNTGTVSGAIGESGGSYGLTFTGNSGTQTIVLSGNNTYTGGTTVANGTLKLDYTTNNTSKVSATSALTLANGANLTLTGNAAANTSQNIGGLTLTGSGVSTISTITQTGQILTVDFSANSGGLTRANNGTLDILVSGGGTAQVKLPGIAASTTVVPWATYNTAVFAGTDTNGFLTAASTANTSTTALGSWATGSTQYTTTGAAFTGSVGTVAIDGITFKDAAARTVAIGAANTLTLNQGVIVTAAVGNNISTISGGSLQGSAAGSGVINLLSNDVSSFTNVSSVIQDNGGTPTSLAKYGPGLVVIGANGGGQNTYTGGTSLNGGVLQIQGAENVGTAGPLGEIGTISFVGGTLQYSAYNQYDYSSRFSTAANQAYSVGTNGQTVTWASNLTSAGSTLTKLDTGTLTLSGANSFTGGTTVSAGILALGSSGALGTTGAITMNGGTVQFSASNTTDYSNRLTIADGTSATFDTNGQNVIFANALGLGSNKTGGLTKAGAGTLTLTGNNTYTGNTAISAGTLEIGVGGTLGGGTYAGTISGAGNLLKSSTDTLTLSGANITLSGTTTVNGGRLVLQNNTTAFTAAIANNASVEFNATGTNNSFIKGAISGAGTFYKTGMGTVQFNTAGQVITATGQFYIQQGTLQNNNNSVNWSGNTASMDISSGAILDLYADPIYVDKLTGTGFVQNNFGNSSGQSGASAFIEKLVVGVAGGSSTFNGVIRNNATGAALGSGAGLGGVQLEKNGAGTITLTGTDLYTGNTNVNAGTLQAGASTSVFGVNSAVTVANAAGVTLDLNGYNVAIGSLAGGGTTGGAVTLGAGTLTLGGNNTSTSFAGVISDTGGPGSLVKVGTGTQTLSGANTYSGTTTVNGGTLALTGSLNNSSGVVINTGGTLKLDFSAAGAPATNIVNSAAALSLGGGTLNLTGLASTTNSQQFNGLTLTAGTASTIQLSANATANPLFLNLGGITRSAGATVNFTLPTGTQSASNGVLTTTANTGGTILGGWATVGGTDWAVSAGDGTNAGNITTLGSYTNDTWASGNNTDVTLAANTLGSAATTNSLRFNKSTASTVTLTGVNTLQSGGILVTSAATAGGTISGGTLTAGSSNELIANLISGAGTFTVASILADNGSSVGLTKGGTGTGLLVLSGVNTYTGNTAISGGTLQISSAGQLGAGNYAGNIPNAGTFKFSSTANQAITGVISGAGALTKDTGTSSVLTLSGGNTYTGVTTISAGVLSVNTLANGGAASGIGASTNAAANLVFGGGTLQYTGATASIDRAFTMSAASTLEVTNAGTTLTIANTNAVSGGSGTQILTKTGAGTLVLGGTADNSSFILNVQSGEVDLGKTGTGSGVRAVAGISGVAQNALVKLTGTGGDQIYEGSVSTNFGVNGLAGTLDLNGNSETTSNFNGTATGVVTNSASSTNAVWTVGATNATAAYAGSIQNGAGTIALTKTGTGTQTLSGTLNYSGPTTVTAGTLLLSSTGTLANGGGIVINGGILNASGAITGAGGVIVNGGMMQFAAPQAFAGGVTVSTVAKLDVNAGGTAAFNFGGVSDFTATDIATLLSASAGGLGFNAGSTLGLDTTNGSGTYSGVVANTANGPLGLTKLGTNTLTLTGANTYTGVTTISGGILSVSQLAIGGLASGIGASSNAAGNLVFNNGTLEYAGTGGSTDHAFTITAGATGTIQVDGSTALTVSGAAAATTGAFVKTGTGTLVLTGANAYTGTTTVKNGVLQLAGNTAARLSGSTTLTIGDTGTTGKLILGSTGLSGIADNKSDLSIAALSSTGLGGSIVGGNATVSTLTDTQTTTTTFAGTLGGGGIENNLAFTFNGTGALTLSGLNSYAGATTIAQGTLTVAQIGYTGANGNLGTYGTINIGATTTAGQLSYNGAGETNNRVINLAGTTGGVTIDQSGSGLLKFVGNLTATGAGAKSLTLQGSGSGEIAGIIPDNTTTNTTSVAKGGTGTWKLSGASTYTGTTTVNGGTLAFTSVKDVGTASALGAPTTAANGTISVGSTTTGGMLLYLGSGDSSNRVINLAGTTGGATIDQSGTGLLKFTSALTATGAGSKTLTLQGSGSGEIAGAIVDNTGTNKTSVTKAGVGTWTLSGADTYTGATSVSGGILNLTGSLTSAITVSSGAVLTGSGGTSANLTFSSGADLLASSSLAGVKGGGTVSVTSTNVVTTDAPANGAQSVNVLRYGGTSPGTSGFNAATNYRSGTYTDTGLVSGTGTISLGYSGFAQTWNKTSGTNTWDLNTSANWTGSADGKFFWGDSVSFGDTAASQTVTITGSLAPSSIAITNSANTYTFSGAGSIIGAGSLTKSGAGIAVISNTGTNSYTGATTVSSGTLTFTTSALNSTSGYFLNDANTGASNTTLRLVGGFTSNRTGLSSIGLRDISPVVVTNNGTGTTTLDFDSTTSNWINGLVTINEAVTLKSTDNGTNGIRAGFISISGPGAGAGNDSVIYDATGSGNDANWNTYENPGTYVPQPNTYLGNVRFTGGTTTIQNKSYANAAYVNLMIPDTASVKVDSGSTVDFVFGNESFDGLNDGVGGGGTVTTGTAGTTLTIGVSNGSGAFSGTITNGSGLGITKAGSGTQVFSGANTYTGVTTITGGTLQFAKRTALYNSTPASWTATNLVVSPGAVAAFNVNDNASTNGEFTAADIATLSGLGTATGGFKSGSYLGLDTTTGNFTYGNAIANTNGGLNTLGLVKLGTNTLTLMAANSYTGNTVISGGTLEIGVGGTLGGGTYAGVVSGTGALLKSSTDTLILSGANTYSGGTTVNAGTLQLGDGSINPTVIGSYSIGSGATLRIQYNSSGSPAALDLTKYTGAGTLAIGTSKSFDHAYGDVTTSLPAGFTGTVQINQGRLATNTSTTLGNASTVIVGVGGQLGMWIGGTFAQNFTVAGSGYGETGYESALRLANSGITTTVNGTVTLTGNTTLGATGTGILNGVISETTPSNLTFGTSSQAGTVVVAGNNSYTGGTTLKFGTARLANTGSANAFGSGAITFAGSSTLGNGTSAGATAKTIANNITINSTITASFDGGFGDLTLGGVISGAGSLNKVSSGNVILTGANTYTGTTTISGGTLQFANESALYNNTLASWTATNLVVNSGATAAFNVGGTNEFTASDIDTLKGLGTATGGFKSGSSLGLDTTNAGGSFTYGSAIGNTNAGANTLGVAKLGSGTLTLTGANTYTGNTTISAGTLEIGGAGGLNTGAYAGTIADSGTLLYSSSAAQTLSGVISGTGTLAKTTGTGILTLSAANTYTGSTSVAAGTLKLTNASALGGSTFAGGTGSLVFDSSVSSHAFTFGGLSGSTNLALLDNAATPNAVALTVGGNNSNTSYSGILSGTNASLTKTGTGTLTLSGANTYTGVTNINGGTLALGNATNTLASTGTVNFGGNATLDLGSTTQSVAKMTFGATATNAITDSGALNITGATAVSVGDIGLTTTLNLSGGATTTFTPTLYIGHAAVTTNTNTATGTVTVAVGSTLSGSTIDLGWSSYSSGNNAPSSTGTLTVNGTVSATTLTLVDLTTGGHSFSAGAATVNLNTGATLFAQTIQPGASQAGTITRTFNFNDGTIENISAGNLMITAFAGTTSSFVLGASGTPTFDITSGHTGTVNQVMSGSGSLTKIDTGTLILNAANTYTGTTTVSGGTLLVSGSISGSIVSVNNGGTLGGTGTVGATTVNSGGTLAPGANGIGTLNVSGTLALGGTSAFDINKTGLILSADLANVSGALTLGGTLTVTATGNALASGDSFDLFSASSITGNFASVNLPTLNPGLSWDTSNLATTGLIAVVPEPGAWVSLLGGCGVLLGLRRRRRF